MCCVRRGEMGDAVVAKGEGEAGVYDVAKAGFCFGGPVPERLGDIGFVVAELPRGLVRRASQKAVASRAVLGFLKTVGLRSSM